jgi:hypothetical protein
MTVVKYKLMAKVQKSESRKILLGNITSSPGLPGIAQYILFIIGMVHLFRGHKVYYLLCRGGGRCPQGVFRKGKIVKAPPCKRCKLSRQLLFLPFKAVPIDINLTNIPRDESPVLSENDLLPTIRHTFKRFHLEEPFNEHVLHVLADFKKSSLSIQYSFSQILNEICPDKVYLFNGVAFPEMTIRALCLKNNISVFTYEVGFRDLSVFISKGLAPSYSFEPTKNLNETELETLDQYLVKRMTGNFEMGLTKFWDTLENASEIEHLGKNYKQVVTIFTNSVYDTSTVFSNLAFSHLFDFIDELSNIVKLYPETLFIFRAHPGEYKRVAYIKDRVVNTKETIGEYLRKTKILDHRNVYFVEPTSSVSSYELIKLSKFVVVYNSTIGVEAAIMGKKILLGGNPKYGTLSFLTVHPDSESFSAEMKVELERKDNVVLNKTDVMEAKAYLFHLVFKQSHSFAEVIGKCPGNHVYLKFNPKWLEGLDWQLQ